MIVGEGIDVTVCVAKSGVGLGRMEVAVDRADVADGGSEVVTGDAFPHPVITNNSKNAKAIIFFIRMVFSSFFRFQQHNGCVIGNNPWELG